MGAIFKREFKSLFTNIRGWVFVSLTVAIAGFFLFFTNFLNTVPQIEYGLMGSVAALTLTIPLLCMGCFAGERRNGNIKFLFSLPVKTHSIVLGKFFAYLLTLAIPTALICTLPILLSSFGTVLMAESYASVLAFFLLGAVIISASMLISSQTSIPAVALLVGFVVSAAAFALPYLAVLLPTTPAASLIALLISGLVISTAVLILSKKPIWSAVTLAALSSVTAIAYLINKNSFSSLFYRIVTALSPFERFKVFTQGIFSLADVLYMLTLTAFFLFITYRTLCRLRHGCSASSRDDTPEIHNSYKRFERRRVLNMLAATVALIAINLSVAAIPAGLLSLDASGLGMYTLSDASLKLAKRTDEDVVLYYLCEQGISDTQTEALLAEYAAAGKHISYKTVNITAHPEFTKQYIGIGYEASTDSGSQVVGNQSILAVSGKRSMLIDASKLYHYRVGSQSYTEAEFREYCNQAAALGYTLSANDYKTFFDADRLIASAIEYVTLDSVSTVYTLKGYGDAELTSKFYENLKYASVSYDELELSEVKYVPENCSALIIVSPERDLTQDDAQKLISFAERGGDIILISSPRNSNMKNLLSVTERFGLTAIEGTVYDSDLDHYQKDGEMTDLILNCNQGHDVVAYLKQRFSSGMSINPRFPSSHAITRLSDYNKDVTITDMLATSEQAYIVHSDGTASETPQTYVAGISSRIDRGDGEDSGNLFWFSSHEAFTDKYLVSRPINMLYLLNSLSYVGGAADYDTSLSIDSRNISGSFLVLEKSVAYTWGILIMAIIPLVSLAAGISRYTVRRHRKRP